MTVTKELTVWNYEPWGGAKTTWQMLNLDEAEMIFDMLEDINSGDNEPMSETDVNDFFWFEDDLIAEWLGYESGEAFYEDRKDRIIT